MESEQREAIRRAAFLKAHGCKACKQVGTRIERDGSACDGMPGVKYLVCQSCGYADPQVKRPRRPRKPKF
jgi:hypothetical protein